MKKQNSLLLLLALVLFIGGCDQDGINGRGEIVTQSRNLGDFHSVRVSVPAKVFITQGSQQSIQVETHENIVGIVETYVMDGTLRVEIDRNIRNLGTLNVYITAPDFQKLSLSGAANLRSEGNLILDDLALSVSGASDIDINGNVDVLTVRSSGASEVRGFSLLTKKVDAKISGAGSLRVTVSEELRVDLSGASNAYYKGQPTIISSTSGASKLINAN